MRNILMLLTVLICTINTVSSQTKSLNINPIKRDTMEFNERKFNIEPYKDWEVDNTYSTVGIQYLKNNDYRVKIVEIGDEKVIEKFQLNSLYVYFQVYDGITSIRKASGQEFRTMATSIWKYYDKNGDLEKEVDMDAPFKFSIEDLVQKFKIEFDIDLMIPSQDISIDRVDFPKSKYFITIQKGKSRTARWIEVDGTTGKILSDEVKTQPEKFSDEWIKQSKAQSRSDISLIEEEKKADKGSRGWGLF